MITQISKPCSAREEEGGEKEERGRGGASPNTQRHASTKQRWLGPALDRLVERMLLNIHDQDAAEHALFQ